MIPRRRRPRRDEVERYVRRLGLWAPRDSRHDLVAEARRHLYDATCRAERAGLSHEDAQRQAIRAFGPAWRISLAARGIDRHPLVAAVFALAGTLRSGPRRLPRLRLLRRARCGRPPRWRIP